jgi:hypothetical protein
VPAPVRCKPILDGVGQQLSDGQFGLQNMTSVNCQNIRCADALEKTCERGLSGRDGPRRERSVRLRCRIRNRFRAPVSREFFQSRLPIEHADAAYICARRGSDRRRQSPRLIREPRVAGLFLPEFLNLPFDGRRKRKGRGIHALFGY